MDITTTIVADGTVALISLDDGKANALSKQAIADLTAALDEAAATDGVAAAVIAGRDGVFSGGFDLNVMRSGDFGAIVDLVADGGDLVRHVYTMDLPVVAACTGHALAAGALLTLACDFRVGASGPYKIGVNEVAIGMVLPRWGLTICRDRLSKRHMQRRVALAEVTDADAAVDAGFLDVVVEPDRVIDTAVEHASAMALLDRNAYRGTMETFRNEVGDRMAAEIASDRAAV